MPIRGDLPSCGADLPSSNVGNQGQQDHEIRDGTIPPLSLESGNEIDRSNHDSQFLTNARSETLVTSNRVGFPPVAQQETGTSNTTRNNQSSLTNAIMMERRLRFIHGHEERSHNANMLHSEQEPLRSGQHQRPSNQGQIPLVVPPSSFLYDISTATSSHHSSDTSRSSSPPNVDEDMSYSMDLSLEYIDYTLLRILDEALNIINDLDQGNFGGEGGSYENEEADEGGETEQIADDELPDDDYDSVVNHYYPRWYRSDRNHDGHRSRGRSGLGRRNQGPNDQNHHQHDDASHPSPPPQ